MDDIVRMITRACSTGNVDLVRHLFDLDLSAHINTLHDIKDYRTNGARTWLMVACRAGHDQIVTLLIGAGADTNIQCSNGGTALHYACLSGHIAIVRLLAIAQYPADVNIQDIKGQTALMIAVKHNRCDVVQLLLTIPDINVNIQLDTAVSGATALHMALTDCPTREIAKQLINAYADLNIQDKEGMTPFMIAVQYGFSEVVQDMMNFVNIVQQREHNQEPINFDIQDKLKRTALIINCYKGYSCCSSVTKLLIDAGANVNLQDSTGSTALMYACDKHQDISVGLLISASANIDLLDSRGNTALMRAANNSAISPAKLLIDSLHMDNIEEFMKLRNCDDQTALIIASSTNNHTIFEAMLCGLLRVTSSKVVMSLLDMKDIKGYTALMYGAERGRVGIVKTCLKFHADTTIWNNAGQTAFDLAAAHKHETVVGSLRETRGAAALVIECMKKQDECQNSLNLLIRLSFSMTFILTSCYVLLRR